MTVRELGGHFQQGLKLIEFAKSKIVGDEIGELFASGHLIL